MSTLSVGDLQGLAVNSNVVTVPTGHTLNVTDAGGLQIGGSAVVSAGLVPISTTTVGTAVSSVTISGCFSADYDDYLVRWSGGVGSANTDMQLRVGGVTAANYAWAYHAVSYGGTETISSNSAESKVRFMGRVNTTFAYVEATIRGPFLTQETFFWAPVATNGVSGRSGGYLNDTTSHTSVEVRPNSGTMTGGTITVYGYAKA